MMKFSLPFSCPTFKNYLSLGFLLGVSFIATNCLGDEPSRKVGQVRTELSFELILPRTRGNPLAGQKWGKIFRELGVPLRVRQRRASDVAGVDQLVYGTVRRVKVLGHIDRNGNIVFPDRKYQPDDTAKLKEWVNELELFGAQGAPTGKPLWGLKKAEFDRLHATLIKTVGKNTSGLGLPQAIQALELPGKYPLKFSVAARAHLTSLEEQQHLFNVKHDLQKFAKGTALAMILRSYSLVFAPRRLPDESIELTIDTLENIENAWPIGWDPNSLNLKRLSLARKMYVTQVIEIDNLPISKLIPKIRTETELDLFIDPQAILSADLNLEKLIVNFPHKRTSWALCLRTVLSKIKLSQQLRVDENNRPFLWVTIYSPQGKPKQK